MDLVYEGLKLYREDKIIYAEFCSPHRVLSTCRAAGGLREDLKYLCNHQNCEPTGHLNSPNAKLAVDDPAAYLEQVCRRHNLPPQHCAALGTAANMRLASLEKLSFRDLTVATVVTAGVETNAGRAGDEAFGWEGPEGYESLKGSPESNAAPKDGTINIMIFINKPLTAGALTGVIITATEAKCAALQELNINSRYSDGLATGTGTDQIAVAAKETGARRLTSSGKHSKLGELIGRSVKTALKEALARQNSLTALSQCSAKIHLERFGVNTQGFLEAIAQNLDDDRAELMRLNSRGLLIDPPTVAAAAALAHLKDKFSAGILPPLVWGEVMGSFAAQLAAAVSGRYDKLADYRLKLAPQPWETDNASFIRLAAQAMALGLRDKWESA